MRYLSLFSGIEAASVAWAPLGWEPVAFSEIEPFPCAVLAKRFPDVPNLGDITKIDWSDYIDKHGRPDLIVGGSPCQSFSLAGTRTGLAGASGLMYEYIRAIQEVRPEWLIWENVTGAFSVERGQAFGQLLVSLDGLGYNLAWRVLDSQFFGVAQRRRRIFLVGCLTEGRAAEVLFEPESMSGDYPSSRDKRKELAEAAGRSVGSSGGSVEIAFKRFVSSSARVLPAYDDGSSPTLTCSDGHVPAVAFAQNQRDEVRLQGGDGQCAGVVEAKPGKNRTYVAQAYAFKMRCGADTYIKQDGNIGTAGKGPLMSADVAYTLATSQDQNVLAMADDDSDGSCLAQAVTISDGTAWVVRKLTPTECERLMGFPDGWTDIGDWVDSKGKRHKASDGPRYKALGNSFAVPVVKWIGERIAAEVTPCRQ